MIDRLPTSWSTSTLRSPDERDELLQELLVGEALAVVIDAWLLDRAVRQLVSDPVVAPDSDTDHKGEE